MGKALDDVPSNRLNVLFLIIINISDERLDGFARSEEGSHGVVDGEVGQLDAENLVANIDER